MNKGAFRGGAFGSAGAFSAPTEFIPTVIPDQVVGLSAVSGNQEVVLSWTPAENAQEYKVYNGPGPTVTSSDTLVATVENETYTHTGRTNGTLYYYAVLATNIIGDATLISATDSATPAITAPLNVAADSSAATEVDVTWDAVSGATSYDLYFNTTGAVDKLDTKLTGVTSPYNHTGRSTAQVYYYVAVALDAATESGVSAEVESTPLAVPADLAVVSGDTAMRVTWGAITGATSYDVYRVTTSPVTTGDLLATGVTSPYDDTGLTAGQDYFYAVRAKATNSETVLSNERGTAPGKRWFLLTGQSNMVGEAPEIAGDELITGFEGLTMLDANDEEVDCVHPIHYTVGADYGPGRDFAKRLQTIVGEDVGLIPCAVGGTYLYQWNPSDPGVGNGEGDEYDEAVRRAGIVTAAGGTIAGVLWLQGEADGLSGTSRTGTEWEQTYAQRAAEYGTELEGMFASLRTALGNASLPIVAAEIGVEDNGTTITTYYEDDFENNITNAEYEEFPHTGADMVDSYHYNRDSYIAIGLLYAQGYMRITGEVVPLAATDHVIVASNGTNTHTWTNSVDATSYNLLWGTSTGVLTNTIVGVTSGYAHTGLTNGTEYFYEVRAINTNGSADTAESSATPSDGKALSLNGTDQYADINPSVTISGATLAWRVKVRVNAFPATNDSATIAACYGSSASVERSWIIRMTDVGGATRRWEFVGHDGTNQSIVAFSPGTAIATGTVYELLFTFDGAETGIDNQATLTQTGEGLLTPTIVSEGSISTLNATTRWFSIGRASDYAQYWNGEIDNLEIFSDIAATTRIHHYEFDNDDCDDSEGTNHLTPQNSPSYVAAL